MRGEGRAGGAWDPEARLVSWGQGGGGGGGGHGGGAAVFAGVAASGALGVGLEAGLVLGRGVPQLLESRRSGGGAGGGAAGVLLCSQPVGRRYRVELRRGRRVRLADLRASLGQQRQRTLLGVQLNGADGSGGQRLQVLRMQEVAGVRAQHLQDPDGEPVCLAQGVRRGQERHRRRHRRPLPASAATAAAAFGCPWVRSSGRIAHLEEAAPLGGRGGRGSTGEASSRGGWARSAAPSAVQQPLRLHPSSTDATAAAAAAAAAAEEEEVEEVAAVAAEESLAEGGLPGGGRRARAPEAVVGEVERRSRGGGGGGGGTEWRRPPRPGASMGKADNGL